MSLIARSDLARTVAEYLIAWGPQLGRPLGVDRPAYCRALLRLEKAGVLQRWTWHVDGLVFEPRSVEAWRLWIAGPKWDDYVEEARCKGLVSKP